MSRSSQDDFKSKNATVEKIFIFIINISFKNPRKRCKYYKKKINFNIIKLQKHLDKCKSYRNNKSFKKFIGNSQQFLSNLIIAMSQIKFDNWKRADMTVYINNLSFTHYQNPYVKNHLYYIDFKYVPLEIKVLSDHILNECYDIVYIKVFLRLKIARWLNFYTNESNNIRRERMINLLTHASSRYNIDEKCFYINFEINDFQIINAIT